MAERRFNDAEVAQIFERATAVGSSGPRPEATLAGLTLHELQSIGKEVGIPAESIVRAAQALEPTEPQPPRKLFGLTIGVGHTVNLSRPLTDAEWERVVVDLRETFNARGKLESAGSLKHWSNGNLQVLLEPTATGHRIRMKTLKSDAYGWLGGGLGMTLFGATLLALAVLKGATSDAGLVAAISVLTAVGAGMLATAAISLPRWARSRRDQMNEVAMRVSNMTLEPPRVGAPRQ
jgi:hypothetical protein